MSFLEWSLEFSQRDIFQMFDCFLLFDGLSFDY
jgi:hypothetical protein